MTHEGGDRYNQLLLCHSLPKDDEGFHHASWFIIQ
jgi:hypothetical protein